MSTELKDPAPAPSALVEIEQARAVQEVQAAIIISRKLPRDEKVAREKIRKACQRTELATAATYAFPRGDTTVTGPSIRFAEVLAQCWGNMQSGVRELSRGANESTAQAYAWDLETNTRAEKTFQVRHIRDTKGGGYRVTSERDIYEIVANQGARRLRACILSIIPGDVIEEGLAECEKTLDAKAEPFSERLKKMTAAFAELGVTAKDLETKLRKKLDAFTSADLKSMGRVLLTIQDGMATVVDYFGPKGTQASGAQAARDAAAKAAGGKGPIGRGVAAIFGGGRKEEAPAPEEEGQLELDEKGQREPGDE